MSDFLEAIRAATRAIRDHYDPQIQAIKTSISLIPAGAKGDRGEQGLPGESIKGETGERGLDGKSPEIGPIISTILQRIPTPRDGKDGERGVDGKDGERGQVGEKGERGERGLPGDSIKGEKGERGADGKDGERGQVGEKGERGERGLPGDSIKGEKGERGADGKDGERGQVGEKGERGERGEVGVRGDQGMQGLPGRDGLNGERGERGERGADGKDGAPGIHGRDALEIDPLPGIDPVKSYARGTYAYDGGGLKRFSGATWQTVACGIADVIEAATTDPREKAIKFVLSDGTERMFNFHFPTMIYQEVYKPGTEYERGDCVTRSGSLWHCQVDKTTAEPGKSSDWLLIVKAGGQGPAGRDGKDGKEGPPGKDRRYE